MLPSSAKNAWEPCEYVPIYNLARLMAGAYQNIVCNFSQKPYLRPQTSPAKGAGAGATECFHFLRFFLPLYGMMARLSDTPVCSLADDTEGTFQMTKMSDRVSILQAVTAFYVYVRIRAKRREQLCCRTGRLPRPALRCADEKTTWAAGSSSVYNRW